MRFHVSIYINTSATSLRDLHLIKSRLMSKETSDIKDISHSSRQVPISCIPHETSRNPKTSGAAHALVDNSRSITN